MSSIASQQKSKEGPRVFIGYVKYFNFLQEFDPAVFNGHPKIGSIYRVIEDKNGYRLYLGRVTNSNIDGLVLGSNLSGTYGDKWEFEIIELTTDNILDFDLSSESLEQLAKWKDGGNEDVWQLLNYAPTTVSLPTRGAPFDDYLARQIKQMLDIAQQRQMRIPDENPVPVPTPIPQKVVDEMDKIVENGANDFNRIVDTDPETAKTICRLLSHIVSTYNPPLPKDPYQVLYELILKIQGRYNGQ